MELPPGNRDGRVDMERSFFQRFLVSPHNRVCAVRSRINFPTLKRDVKFRAAEADNEFRIFESDEMGEDAAARVDRMTDRLRADSDSRGCAQFLQGIEPGLPPGKKNIRIAALRGAQKNDFVEIVLCPRRSE